MEEFSQAYYKVVQGSRQHLIVVLVDKPEPGILPPELDNYLMRHTYIEAHNFVQDMDVIREKIRCAMPNVALKQMKVSIYFMYLAQIILPGTKSMALKLILLAKISQGYNPHSH